MNNTTYIILDIETTGLSKHYHKMTEISAFKMKNWEILEEYTTLINPETPIPRFITKLTGIDNTMVKDAPVVSEITKPLAKFLGNDPIVAHNATFDRGFIEEALQRYNNITLTNDSVCTRKLANRLVPELPKKKLGHLCEHFCIHNDAAHRARGDALATTYLFGNFQKILLDNGFITHEDILRIQSLSPSKISMSK